MWDAIKPIILPHGGGTITIIPQSMRWNPPLPKVQEIEWTPIVRTPNVLGGKPRITGHRISVQDVVIWHERMGLSVGEIAAKYDLTPDEVHTALTYYADHHDEIEESIRADEAFVAEMRQRHPSTLKARRGG